MFEFEITKRENLYACAGCSCVARFRSFIYLRQKRRKAGGGRRGGNPLRRGRGPKGCRATPRRFSSPPRLDSRLVMGIRVVARLMLVSAMGSTRISFP